jgi:hypothetical protein
MKTVFSSDEIPHLWANQRAESGRSPGNVSFSGRVLFSYGTWIGEILQNGVFLLNSRSFSVTTSKQQSRARQAIPSGATVFHVYQTHMGDRSFSTHGETPKQTGLRVYTEHVDRAANVLAEAKSSRQPKRDRLEGEAGEILAEAQRVSNVFKLGKKVSKGTIDRLAEAKKRAERKQDAARAIALEKSRADEMARVDKWRAGEGLAWFGASSFAGAMLRVSPTNRDVIETSKGIQIARNIAASLWAFISQHRATGWRRDGEDAGKVQTLGGTVWRLDAINSEGVIAGCHRFSWAELERFVAASDLV